MTDSETLVGKLWNTATSSVMQRPPWRRVYCGDFVEQLTYLLLLKVAEEQLELGMPCVVPEGLDWLLLLKLSGEALEAQYIKILNEPGTTDDKLGMILRSGQNRIQDPAKLQRVIHDLMDGETWMGLDVDVRATRSTGEAPVRAPVAPRGKHQVSRRILLDVRAR